MNYQRHCMTSNMCVKTEMHIRPYGTHNVICICANATQLLKSLQSQENFQLPLNYVGPYSCFVLQMSWQHQWPCEKLEVCRVFFYFAYITFFNNVCFTGYRIILPCLNLEQILHHGFIYFLPKPDKHNTCDFYTFIIA